jgi:hypothetical protein
LQVFAFQPQRTAAGLDVEQRRSSHGRRNPDCGVGNVSKGDECGQRTKYIGLMARYTLVYGLRLIEEGTMVSADDAKLRLRNGETAGLTLHTIDGTIPQLRRALDRSLDAFFEFLPGATDEDKRDFDDS